MQPEAPPNEVMEIIEPLLRHAVICRQSKETFMPVSFGLLPSADEPGIIERLEVVFG